MVGIKINNKCVATFFRHNFDLGLFCLYKDNSDGTALFYEKNEIGREINSTIKIENRLIKYRWREMICVD